MDADSVLDVCLSMYGISPLNIHMLTGVGGENLSSMLPFYILTKSITTNFFMTVRYWGAGLLSLMTLLSIGQNVPIVVKEGAAIEQFVPENWRIIQEAVGDLNKDIYEDAAFVIQEMDPKRIETRNGNVVDTLDTNPRILIIAFRDPVSKAFKLKEVSRTFILNHQSFNMDDPFDGIAILEGVLSVRFHLWYNMGSWFSTVLDYKFRYQQNDFYLIGAEFDETHRGTSEVVKRSFNFSTKKMRETRITLENTPNGESIEKEKIEWKGLDVKELKTFKTLATPLAWMVAPGVQI
jgi:hypothetical protein